MNRMLIAGLAIGAAIGWSQAQSPPPANDGAQPKANPCAVNDPPRECRIFTLPGRPAAPSTGDNIQLKMAPSNDLRLQNRDRDDRLRLPSVNTGKAS